MVGPKCYQMLHRIHECTRCGALPGERCLGAKGPIEWSHIERKRKFRTFRQGTPALYRIVRDVVAEHLVSGRPVRLPGYLVLYGIREAVEKVCSPRKTPNGAQ